MTYEFILTETPADGVGLVRLNRPDALNALNRTMLGEIFDALEAFDGDENIGCTVVTGSDKAFAAGADIKEMAAMSMVDAMQVDFTDWTRISNTKKPVIAAVSGWALGGGCEVALACDMIVASETARFGQPEITLGIMPGAGGTQRLFRAVGKAVTMEMVLANRHLTAQEALTAGLVNHVHPVEDYFDKTVELAQTIAGMPRVSVELAKAAVLMAQEVGLSAGMEYERRLFNSTFATEDRTEGMAAFIEKRKAAWKHR